MTERKFQDEAALQCILYESPEAIPIEKLGEDQLRPKVFIKEAGLPGSGNTDLIGIDEKGGITIIECKLATNRDIRRKVIGQLLEYAAYLWGMGYDQFDDICRTAEGWKDKNLADAVQATIEGAHEGWEQEFKESVTSTLEKGHFRLIVAVDTLNDELKRIIEFLNSRGKGFPEIHALEMRQFKIDEIEMLVPELFGERHEATDVMMNEERFLSESSGICQKLYSGLKQLARGGRFQTSGFTRRGYAFRCPKTTLLVLYPDYLETWIVQGQSADVLGKQASEEFWASIFQVPALEKKRGMKTPRSNFTRDMWTQDDVNTFVSALERLGSHLQPQ